MQEESHKFSQLFSRIEKVRLVLDLKWDELAERMDCNRSLFFQVKRGNCGFSDRNMARFEKLETEAGITPISPEVRQDWMERMPVDLNAAEKAQSLMMEAKDSRRAAAMFRKMAADEEKQADELESFAKELLARGKAKAKS